MEQEPKIESKPEKNKPLLERTSENLEVRIKEEWEAFFEAVKAGDLGHIDVMARRMYIKEVKIAKATVDIGIALKNLAKAIIDPQ